MPLPSAKTEFQVALAAAIQGRPAEPQARLIAVDEANAPHNTPSPVQGLQTSLVEAFSEREMAHSDVERGFFAVGISGAVLFSGLVWAGIYFAVKLF